MPYQKGPQKADVTPQVRHTNIAIVKYKAKKARFEIACYKNKVINWRSGVEADLDEVLQMEQVFKSVTTGIRATKKSLKKAFGTHNQTECCKIILEKGELQVSDKEREHAFKLMFNEVAQMVASMCFNPKSQRPYTTNLIKDAMIKNQFHLNTGKSSKKQALDCVKFLSRKMDLERMKMLISITIPTVIWTEGSPLRTLLNDMILEIRVLTPQGDDVVVQAIIAPESFRRVSAGVQDALAGEDELIGIDDVGVLSRNLGVTVVNAAIEWMSPENQVEVSSNDKVDDADFAASIAVESDDEDKEETEILLAVSAVAQAQQDDRTVAIPASSTVEKSRVCIPTNTSKQAATVGVPGLPKLSCRKCNAYFETRKELGQHMRSEWHRHNLKRQLKGIGPITEEGFVDLTAAEREVIENIEGNYR